MRYTTLFLDEVGNKIKSISIELMDNILSQSE